MLFLIVLSWLFCLFVLYGSILWLFYRDSKSIADDADADDVSDGDSPYNDPVFFSLPSTYCDLVSMGSPFLLRVYSFWWGPQRVTEANAANETPFAVALRLRDADMIRALVDVGFARPLDNEMLLQTVRAGDVAALRVILTNFDFAFSEQRSALRAVAAVPDVDFVETFFDLQSNYVLNDYVDVAVTTQFVSVALEHKNLVALQSFAKRLPNLDDDVACQFVYDVWRLSLARPPSWHVAVRKLVSMPCTHAAHTVVFDFTSNGSYDLEPLFRDLFVHFDANTYASFMQFGSDALIRDLQHNKGGRWLLADNVRTGFAIVASSLARLVPECLSSSVAAHIDALDSLTITSAFKLANVWPSAADDNGRSSRCGGK